MTPFPMHEAGHDGSEVDKEQHELLQVAAVAVASMENARFGQAEAEGWVLDADGEPDAMQAFAVLDDVFHERARQDEKWGTQDHSRLEWAMILAEEIGEWAHELRIRFDPEPTVQEFLLKQVLETMERAGDGARNWLENHEWPERQQRVYDEEGRSGV